MIFLKTPPLIIYDLLVSNPPYSCKPKVFKRLAEIDCSNHWVMFCSCIHDDF